MKYLSVALPIPVFKTFSYSCEGDVSSKKEVIDVSYKKEVIDVEIGSRVSVPFGKTLKTGYVVGIFNERPKVNYPIKNIKEVVDEKSLISPELMELARRMSDYYITSIGEILSVVLPVSLKYVKRKVKVEVKKDSYEKGFLLSPEQKKVIEPILKKAKENTFAKFLLHGVTDSGKTEVYMRLIALLISLKKQVIMLVPEIAITAQLKEMFIKRFGADKVGIWHSRITNSKKMDYVRKMRNGQLDILVGPRSAVFASFPNLGAIIIDEEQDSSYKSNSLPYYDARWVARERCKIENAILIQGSATPSIESLYLARSGEYHYLKMVERIHQADHPELVIVDMKREHRERQHGGIFSKYLLDELNKIINQKRQCILFLNRRGYAPFVVCKNCGQNIKCPNCNITLVYHQFLQKGENRYFLQSGENRYGRESLMCHRCGYTREIPLKCPSCAGVTFKYLGAGTQRVESILKKIFPGARIVRMDIDTTMGPGSTDMIFRDFKEGKYDIMVGTQIVAKGWDFSNVDLVGVINSDVALMMPDFRAPERTFSLLKQVEGRTGRGRNRGKIVVQTFNPVHYSIKMLFEKDNMKFFEKEIEIRESAGFPPFQKLINIVSTHKNEKTASKNIYYCRDFIQDNIKDISLLGPAPCPVHKVRGNYRWQLLIKYCNEEVRNKLGEMVMRGKFPGRLKVDVDPHDML